MEHWLSCIPPKTSHHAKRIVRRGKFTSLADKMELVAARGDLIAMLQQVAPPQPLDCPLRLKLAYFWPYNSSDTKDARIHNRLLAQASKPDCDNLAKTFIDCLVRTGFLVNDSRIWHLDVAKYRWAYSGIYFRLEEKRGELPESLIRYSAARKGIDSGLAAGPPDQAGEGSGTGPAQSDDLGPDGQLRPGSESAALEWPYDARLRLCTVCGRSDVTTTFDGKDRRCPICQRAHLATVRCSECGGPGGVIYAGRSFCYGCYQSVRA